MPRRLGSKLPATERTNSQVAAAAPELSRRQLEYWVEMGWVHPESEPARGHPRTFPPVELKILGLMYRLAVAGFPARNAAWIARAAVTQTERTGEDAVVDLAPGISVLIGR